MQIEQLRFNMIEQQIRPWDVLDPVVLSLLAEVKREEFVPASAKALAFFDIEIPFGDGQCMLAPKVEGRIMQALQRDGTENVCEIGTGTGYLTALLAKSSKFVTSLEIDAERSKQAALNLAQAGIKNVNLVVTDGSQAYSKGSPYDVLVLGASVPVLLPIISQQVKVGGKIFAIVGDAPAMQAKLIVRVSKTEYKETVLFETVTPLMINSSQPKRFHF